MVTNHCKIYLLNQDNYRIVILVITLSDLNKRERVVRKSLVDIEKNFKSNKISKIDYAKMKKQKQDELKKIDLERKDVITMLPPMPPPPRPVKSSVTSKPAVKTISATTEGGVELKKLEKDVLFTQSEMSKLFAEVVKNRERIKKIEHDMSNLSSMGQKGPPVDTKAIEDRFSKEIERINNSLMDKDSKGREEIDKMAGDVRTVKRDIEEIRKMTQVFNTLDVAGIRRDIESLKSKTQWLEDEMKNFDIEPLYELMKELENKMSSGRIATAPVIIE